MVIGQDNEVQQQGIDTCAIKSQQIILNDFLSPENQVTEQQLVDWSIANGLYQGGGTNPSDVGKILQAGGVPCTQKVDANIFDLTNELAQGHKIIIGVDSGELWEPGLKEWFEDIFAGDNADHALIVAGIDNTDPNNPKVLLTDPGSGDTCKPYPLDQFMDAWQDSGCFMVSTDVSPAEFASTQIQHGQPSMYLPEIAGQSYQDFQLFYDMSLALPSYSEWNYNMYPQYPLSSLCDAYLSGTTMSGIGDCYFSQFINGHDFMLNYTDTLDFGIENVADPNTVSLMDNFLSSDLDISTTDLHNFFDSQAHHYIEIGDLNTANFFSQQANFVEYCNVIGADPTDFYQQFDFASADDGSGLNIHDGLSLI